MRPAFRISIAALLIIIAFLLPACRAVSTDDPAYRMDLVKEIKAFEKDLGFMETENFLTYSEETESYDYHFYAPALSLPYSLGDPALMFGEGKPESAGLDPKEYDIYFYSIQAVAGIKTPITKSLIQSPLDRFIHVIIHEDWHEQIDLPLVIEEPSGETVSLAAAMIFTERKYGRESSVYKALKRELDGKLRESAVYTDYYGRLQSLYAGYKAGSVTETEALDRKHKLIETFANELRTIWGTKPDYLNNAFIAFEMTYLRNLPLMEQVYTASGYNMEKTIQIFRNMPEQGKTTENLNEVLAIEKAALEYLGDFK